jgi:hypothetical protein
LGSVGVVVVDELLLLVAIGLEKKARDLVEAAADAMQEAFGAAERVIALQGLQEVFLHLASAVELAGGHFLLELVDLARCQVADIALVVQDEQSVEALVAEDAQPIAQATLAHMQEVSDLRDGFTIIEPKQCEESLLDLARKVGTKEFLDLTSLSVVQRKVHEYPSSRRIGSVLSPEYGFHGKSRVTSE